MKRPAPFLCALVALASAGALLLARIGTGGSDRDELAAVASAAARGQQALETCLFQGLEPGAWADHDLVFRLSGYDWRPCLQDRNWEVRYRLNSAPDTPAIQAYRRATALGDDLGMCETALALRQALADLQAAAGHEPIDVPAACELSGPPLERVAAPHPREHMALVVSREPELVARFQPDDPSWSHAALRDGAWVKLPRYPERQLLFDPASLVAVAAGDPQPVLHHDGKAWRTTGHAPRGFAVRALRSTADGGLVAVAVAHRDHRVAVLRAASPDARLEVVATRQLDATSGCPELAIHLDAEGTVLLAHDTATDDGWTVEISRHAPGDSQFEVSQVGRFEAAGQASLHACGPKRWLHRRGPDRQPSTVLVSADGGRSFEKAGTVPPGGAVACFDDGALIWVGRLRPAGSLHAVPCTGEGRPCSPFEPGYIGGTRAFITLDGAKLVAFDPRSDAGLVWTAANWEPPGTERNVGVRGPDGHDGLRNLWRLGDRLLVELPIP